MKPQSISRMLPFLLLALFAALIASILPGGHGQAQQALTATSTATPTATPAPPAVPGNFAGKGTANGVALSWSAPAGGATGYNIHRTWPRHSKTGTTVAYFLGSSTSYTDSDVAVAGSYRYQIQAVRGDLLSVWSSTLIVVVPESVVPTATGTPVPSTATPTSTPTPTATLTATPTSYPPGFPTPTPTATPTLTATPTSTPIGLPTATPTATSPAIPGNFAGKVTDNGIVLSWTAPEGGADNYIIYRTWPRSSKDGTTVSYRVPGSSTRYTDSDVAVPGGHYRYNIRAFRSGWGSGYSDLLTVVVPESALPTATGTPVSSTATPTPTATVVSGQAGADESRTVTPAITLTAQTGSNAVELRWNAVSGAVRYELKVWWDPLADWLRIGGDDLTGTSYTHTGLTPGRKYFYTILAVNAAGETSEWLGRKTNEYPSVTVPQEVSAGGTSTVTPTPTATAASLSTPAPTATAASGLSVPTLTPQATEGGVELSWGIVQGAVRYELMVWWDPLPAWLPIGGDDLTGTSYTHTGLTPGTRYFYTIRTVNAAGRKSEWLGEKTKEYPSVTVSQGVSAGDGTSTVTPTPTATAASGLSVPTLTAQATESGVELSWGIVQGAVRYELKVWWHPLADWQLIGAVTDTSYTHSGLTAGRKYYYTIRAVNAAGETSYWLGAKTNEYPSVTVAQPR